MNLNGAVDEIELPVNDNEVYVHNSWANSIPIVIHGNGPSKVGHSMQWQTQRRSAPASGNFLQRPPFPPTIQVCV